ncbi:MAG: TfoX/Sxy family protein [Solirubrobacteraceae bacterium]|nr:TfoX/Sxy family protein [Solirubrobacteraceae bacterium]
MAYDEELAFRIMGAVDGIDGLTTKKMFGGLGFLVDGHMAVAVSGKGGLMVRIDPSHAKALVAREGVERMVMGGRSTDGWLRVTEDAVDAEGDLREWVDRGLAFVATLPPK